MHKVAWATYYDPRLEKSNLHKYALKLSPFLPFHDGTEGLKLLLSKHFPL